MLAVEHLQSASNLTVIEFPELGDPEEAGGGFELLLIHPLDEDANSSLVISKLHSVIKDIQHDLDNPLDVNVDLIWDVLRYEAHQLYLLLHGLNVYQLDDLAQLPLEVNWVLQELNLVVEEVARLKKVLNHVHKDLAVC